MRSLVRLTGSMRQGCAGGFDAQQVIQVRSRPHGRPPDALGGRRLILALEHETYGHISIETC